MPSRVRFLIAAAAIVSPLHVVAVGQAATQPALRAAFLYNFAKFAEWPGAAAGDAPLTLCVLEDDAVENALSELVGESYINGRPVIISEDAHGARLRACHLLYVGDVGPERITSILGVLAEAPVLTVSTGDVFVRQGGMVGLFVEEGRMRFSINSGAVQRAGVKLSSRLLKLAKILEDGTP